MITTLNQLIKNLYPPDAQILYPPNDTPMSLGNYFQLSNDRIRYPEFPIFDPHLKTPSPAKVSSFITYKNTLAISDFANISYFLPQVANFRGEWLRQIPLFTRHMGHVPKDRPLALEGGPCLFGTDEMFLHGKSLEGEPCCFDLNLLFGKIRDTKQAEDFFAGLQLHTLSFEVRKPGITCQEYEFFDCLFQFAWLLDAPLMITIPDISYLKFFENMLSSIQEPQRSEILAAYRQALHQITDLYLQFAARFQAHYRLAKLEILHHRAQDLLNIFYQQRQPYLKTKNLTSCSLRLSSVADYVSMPASPFYLWGIRDIIEINSTDETDSIRKCMRNHRQQVHFYPLMIPEKVNRRQDATIFESRREDKEYVFLDSLAFS